MAEFLFNASSFLQKKVKDNGFGYANVKKHLPDNYTITRLISDLKLSDSDVEGVFINGKSGAFDYVIQNGDRVALIPPGIPGPHRYLFGIRQNT